MIHQPEWMPNGTDIAYQLFHAGKNELMSGTTALVTGEEVFPFRASFTKGWRYFYTSDGKIRMRRTGSNSVSTVGFTAAVQLVTPKYTKKRRDFDSPREHEVVGIGSPVLSPDGSSVAFRALNDIYTMRIGGEPTPLFKDQWWKSDPDRSPDGRRLAFATDRSGSLNLWIRDLASGVDTQVTHFTTSAAVSCRWSPDGRELAYLDQNGALFTVDIASGDVQRVFDATFEPGRPTWSPDGSVIALAAVQPYSKRYREGLSKILLVNRRTGEATYVDPAPDPALDPSLQTRGDDGPVWSPDGRSMVYAMESVLWVLPVGRDGKPTGKARQITTDVSDAPTWSGDSSTVLYLSGGKLRTVKVSGRSRSETVKVRLTWRNVKGPDRLVIHAGRMWDGTRSSVRRDVDILVSGQRITGVEPHRAARPGTFVDASDKFVMPGIIDIHHHRQMQGYSYGSRQGPLWLSLGITTTRSPGDPAYHMVEERESVQSGRRVAPRFFGTGEAVDGARIYYNFMRPTFSQPQLGLELERAAALDYDLMKCYVRLPVMWHKQVIDWAHKRGAPVTSHYHYPAMALGGDGTEHIGATNRFGYSRTVTNVGSGFSDVISMFNDSQMARTPTLFGSSTLYREDTSLVNDPRVRRMYPQPYLGAYGHLVVLRVGDLAYAHVHPEGTPGDGHTAPGPAVAFHADLATGGAYRLFLDFQTGGVVHTAAFTATTVTSAQTTDQTVNRANLEHQVDQVREMIRGGGVVTTGTDSPIDHLAISTHMNLRAMVKYGITPREALITATSNSWAYLGERLGQVAPGYYADLAIIDGDPLTKINDAASVTAVVTSGLHRTVEELLAPYAGPDSSVAPLAVRASGANRVLPAVPRHQSTKGFWWNEPAVVEAARDSCCAPP